MLSTPIETLREWLQRAGLDEIYVSWVAEAAELTLVAVAAYAAARVTRGVLLRVVHRLAKTTSTDLDDMLIRRRVFHRAAHLAPALVIWLMAPLAVESEAVIAFAKRGAEIYMLLVALLVADAALNAANDIYQKFEVSRRVPIKGYLQVIKLVLSLAVVIVSISIVIDRSPLLIFSGLGALTAVLLLVFKDSILGLVAGIQLVANDMVRPGDWIEMPKYGADGDVMEITLTTVKVRNWDKTVTTVPAYSLVSDSFKNWRGMTEAGGRRIKRSLSIDVKSIKFLTPELLERLSKVQKLQDYIAHKTRELEEYNQQLQVDESVLANGRRMTNIGTFRAYLIQYLREHPKLHQDMTLLVRQLQPTERGLPIEIYTFTNEIAWADYEDIQADIFDHIFAALEVFDLRAYQLPSGWDVSEGLSRWGQQAAPSV